VSGGLTAAGSQGFAPVTLREVIRSYQAQVATTIQQFNGFIARYVGDGVLMSGDMRNPSTDDGENPATPG
jgi:class 3 adenylate cyclase